MPEIDANVIDVAEILVSMFGKVEERANVEASTLIRGKKKHKNRGGPCLLHALRLFSSA